jgi:hypothetical protein
MEVFFASCGFFVIPSLQAAGILQRSKPDDRRVGPRLDRSRDERASGVFDKRDL